MNGILSVCECSLVVSALIVGGNIQTLITIIKFVWTFALRGEDAKTSSSRPLTPARTPTSYLVNLSPSNNISSF